MRFLIIGAGALGGYFGGRLIQAGQDVTFLVRPGRAAELNASGLVIRSPMGDLDIPHPAHVLASELRDPFDVILLACKAYDLAQTIEDFAPAVGPESAILPVLNGMRHLDTLDARFGAERVLGGHCLISAVLDAKHVIRHLNDMHVLGFGERAGGLSARVNAIAAACAGAGFVAQPSAVILQEMWEKWVFIASAAGITCLMRASIGDIVEAGAGDLAPTLYDECAKIAEEAGFAPRPQAKQRGLAVLTAAGSPITASMLKDIERGSRTEADHILADLLRRARGPARSGALLPIALAHLKAYEARREREALAQRTP